MAAAVLSDRYISGRFLPDKAIDLVDEAASRLRIEIDSLPTEIDVVERRIRQLEIERVALAKETDEASRERLAKLDEELANLRESADGMKAHWQGEKDAITAINDVKEEMEALRGEAERYERNGELAKASEIRYGRIPGAFQPYRRGHQAPRRAPGRQQDAEAGGGRGGRGRSRGQMDGRTR